MAAGRVNMHYQSGENASLRRSTLSVGGPFNFVNRTKQMLQEVQEVKKSLSNNLHLDLRSNDDARFYSIIDSLPRNEEALEALRLRQLVRDSIKSTEKEIQEIVKRQILEEQAENPFFSGQKKVNAEGIKSKNTSNVHATVSLRTPMTKKSKDINAQKNYKKTGTYLRNTPGAEQKQDSSKSTPLECERYRIAQAIKSTEEFYMRHIYGKHDFQESRGKLGQLPLVNQEMLPTSGKISVRAKPSSSVSKNINLPMNDTKMMQKSAPNFQTKDKYFPCAIALAPPNRQKLPESATENVDHISIPSVIPKQSVIKQTNVALITVGEERTLDKKPLMLQVLPGIDIKGKPSLDVKRDNTKIVVIQDEVHSQHPLLYPQMEYSMSSNERSQKQFNQEESDNEHDQLLSIQQNIDSRVNPALLAQIVKVVKDSCKKFEGNVPAKSDTNREFLKNIIVDVVHEDLQRRCDEMKALNASPAVKLQTSVPNLCSMTDVEIQCEERSQGVDKDIQVCIEPVAKFIELVSEYVQVSTPPASHRDDSTQVGTDHKDIIVVEASSQTCSSIHHFGTQLSSEDVLSEPITILGSEKVLPKEICMSSNVNGKVLIDAVSPVENELTTVPIQETETVLSSCNVTPVIDSTATISHSPDPADNNSGLDMFPQKESCLKKVSAVLLNPIEISSSTTTSPSVTISDNDFMEDLFSEGEFPLPKHLISIHKKIPALAKSSKVCKKEKEPGESSLSEGEAPLNCLNLSESSLQNISGFEIVYPRVRSSKGHVLEFSESSVAENMSGSLNSTFDLSEGQQVVCLNVPPASPDYVPDILHSCSEEKVLSQGEIEFKNYFIQNNLSTPHNVDLTISDSQNMNPLSPTKNQDVQRSDHQTLHVIPAECVDLSPIHPNPTEVMRGSHLRKDNFNVKEKNNFEVNSCSNCITIPFQNKNDSYSHLQCIKDTKSVTFNQESPYAYHKQLSNLQSASLPSSDHRCQLLDERPVKEKSPSL